MSSLPVSASRRDELESPDPRVLRCVRQVALAGLALVMVWPAMRGNSAWLGWLPLWLVGMPLTAWWALYRFRLPAAWWVRGRHARRTPVRRERPQARRLSRPGRIARAA